ncbi:hypothetical protein ES703_82074 [subsurface metagenome]
MSEKQFEHINVELDNDNNYAVVSINGLGNFSMIS